MRSHLRKGGRWGEGEREVGGGDGGGGDTVSEALAQPWKMALPPILKMRTVIFAEAHRVRSVRAETLSWEASFRGSLLLS